MIRKLFSFEHKTITVDKLMSFAGNIDYFAFAAEVNKFVGEGILEPVKASGKNGRRPELFNKYRICKPENDYSATLEEIKLLHPKLNHSKYAKQPEMYIRYKKEIDLLSQFLWERENLLKSPMSINERSFQICGEEKLLKDKSILKSVLKYNELDPSFLNYYETPEPFFEYVFANSEIMNVLVVENKDTWFSLRKIMGEDKLNRLFREYHVLLYGEGKKIIRKNDRFKEYDNLLGGSQNKYYYFGDLDYEGIEIYQTLVKNNQDLDINLSIELYSWMLIESKKYSLPNTKEGQKKKDIEIFLRNFTEEETQRINEILEGGLYIPQEILNYPLLKTKMMEGLK